MVKVLERRPSSRNPEVIYTITQWQDGNVTCDCPTCQNGYPCWPMRKIVARIELDAMIREKHRLSPMALPDKKQLISEQWEYVNQYQIGRHF